MIIEPFHHVKAKGNDLSEVSLQFQEVTYNQVHLVCPTDEHNQPTILRTEKSSHFLAIRTIISTPGNHNDAKFVENEFDIVFNNHKELIACFWPSRHVVCFDEVSLLIHQLVIITLLKHQDIPHAQQ
jgi:hypothetical protein